MRGLIITTKKSESGSFAFTLTGAFARPNHLISLSRKQHRKKILCVACSCRTRLFFFSGVGPASCTCRQKYNRSICPTVVLQQWSKNILSISHIEIDPFTLRSNIDQSCNSRIRALTKRYHFTSY